jgi:putative transposase
VGTFDSKTADRQKAPVRYRVFMSRLRRIAVSDRYFFVTSNLDRSRAFLNDRDFEDLAGAIARARAEQRFWITAWVFLPDHWHAIVVYPRHPLAISSVLKTIKLRATLAINHRTHESGPVWQGRFFDRILRTVKELWETVDYIHMNPVRRGLVSRPEDWRWSSIHAYQNPGYEAVLPSDKVNLPADPDSRLW